MEAPLRYETPAILLTFSRCKHSGDELTTTDISFVPLFNSHVYGRCTKLKHSRKQYCGLTPGRRALFQSFPCTGWAVVYKLFDLAVSYRFSYHKKKSIAFEWDWTIEIGFRILKTCRMSQGYFELEIQFKSVLCKYASPFVMSVACCLM
jgi:hypothetical protein